MNTGSAPTGVQNVFVLVLENRSFDHLLGFSAISGTDAVNGEDRIIDGLLGAETNSYQGKSYLVSHPADFVISADPGHEFSDVLMQLAGEKAVYPEGGPYPEIDNSGFVANYAVNNSHRQVNLNPAEVMKCYEPSQLPVLTALAHEFVVCDRWFSAMPGSTWPNRFFLHGASSGDLDDSPSLDQLAEWELLHGFALPNGTIFDRLHAASVPWRIYAGDNFPQVRALAGIKDSDLRPYANLSADLASASYPAAYTFIEPDYGHVTSDYRCGTSQHPLDDITRGERLIKCTYEAIRQSPIWETSLLVITWDEHGGFYDHVAPPSALPPGDTPLRRHNRHGFAFNQYGPRVPAVVVSPLIPRNLIDGRLYDHTSIAATMETLFGLPPLTARDSAANDLSTLVTLPQPRRDTPATLPEPAVSGVTGCHPVPACGPTAALSDAGRGAALAPPRERPAASRPEAPIEVDPNLAGFVHVALRRDLSITPPSEHQERIAHARSVLTKADARDYLQEVDRRLISASSAPN
jgi:phospholipase C